MAISSQKLAFRTKELSQLITAITPCSDSLRQHQKNFLMRSSLAVAVTSVELVLGRIAAFYN